MGGVVLAGMLALRAVASAGDAAIIDRPVWKTMPDITAISQSLPTDHDYEGQIELICRIRDTAGHVKCQVIGLGPAIPAGYDWAEIVRRAMDAGAAIDMARTKGARFGQLVHISYRIVLD